MMPFKICILIERLNKGGAERSAGLLSKILTNLGYDTYIITVFNDIAYPYQAKLINIGEIENTSGSITNKLNRYWQIHKQFRNHNFDVILDFRLKTVFLREVFLNFFVFRNKKIINMVRSYYLKWYFPRPRILARFLYKNYFGINTVSLKIKHAIETQYRFNNINVIHSPVDFSCINEKLKTVERIENEFIVAVGRLQPIKQFDKLIEAYSKSILPKRNIQLYIIGSGDEEVNLRHKIKDLNLEDKVKIIKFNENPFKYYEQAKFLVLCSRNEGFPRVLVESLACQTPVISFDCNSGPSEIITNEKNGLLVEDQDFRMLTMAMDRMINDVVLYNKCAENARSSVDKFSLEEIEKQWKSYLSVLMAK